MKKIESKKTLLAISAGRKPDIGDFLSGICIGFSVGVLLMPGPKEASLLTKYALKLAAVGGATCDIKDLKDILPW